MTTGTQQLRDFSDWLDRRYPANVSMGVRAAADYIDAQAAEIERLKTALRGMLQLDEENHQRFSGDEDVCKEVRDARAALSGEGK